MKKFSFILFMLLICSVLFAEEIIQEPYERCSPDDFAIAPWGFRSSEGDLIDYDKSSDELYQAGFNLSSFVQPKDLHFAVKHNLNGILLADPLIDNKIPNDKDKYTAWAKKVKEVAGENFNKVSFVFVTDEPQKDRLPWMTEKCSAIKNIIGAEPYVNFLPSHAISKYLNNSYEDFYGEFVNKCGLSTLSYDSYCFFVDYGFDEDQFYTDIEDMKNMAEKHNVKFINTILSNAHFNYAEPTEFSINVQGWSTLAYGGKGIFYWTFNNVERGNYRRAAYYKNGARNDLWYIIRDLNFSIHYIMPYYKNLKNVNVYHVGNIPKGARGAETAKVVQKCTVTTNQYGDDQRTQFTPNYLVGEFVGSDGNEYAIIVNKSPKYSIYVKEFEFKKGKTISRISALRKKNPEVEFTGEDRWIAPGYGILLKGKVPENMTFEALDNWKFIKDPKDQGLSKGYEKFSTSFNHWQKIDVNTNWEETIGDYDGYGWYKIRKEFDRAKKVFLYFGAADEEATVYVNGKLALEHTCAKTGMTPVQLWNKPFAVNITPFLKTGINDITVKVHDDKKAGGIYKGVTAVYTDKDLTEDFILKNISD